jgi:hypothetical protein
MEVNAVMQPLEEVRKETVNVVISGGWAQGFHFVPLCPVCILKINSYK